MKNPFFDPAGPFNPDAIHDTIQRALESAGLDTRSGPMREVSDTIRRALDPLAHADAAARTAAADAATIVDVQAREVSPNPDGEGTALPGLPSADTAPATGRFESHTFSNAAGTRAYKLYIPAAKVAAHTTAPRPIIVMLHGCTQSADDFAAGTQMNRLAEEQGFLVVYPEQAAQANASRCWNWFNPQDQRRDGGEPSLIADIVRLVARQHGGDLQRVFVAGLSAGAAMAVVLGQTYPELFAGVGAHSGLPYGSAHDIPSAMAAMKGGRGAGPRPSSPTAAAQRTVQPVPLIAFHGDRDHTVQASNTEQLVHQARQAHAATASGSLHTTTQTGEAAGNRAFRRVIHTDDQGHARIEHWTLHGGGHAWSGGNPNGSFTDRHGPDASAEMVRFFKALPVGKTR